ncbi:cell envelope biogenesis protein OmpA [Neptunitalea chrysea]|uniref:Cell envelope biogenesis protein OmpA n=1 Tax=Neptunitalea chrysea TaxID=1647581 RepID=A0A9W6EUZ5_9FLAO|nr:OmpA family protein [Neptunitalea chrysea]GLB54110.1 cell envelope biogenesis protein OmpA [Neptunitalea chrysea]
MIKRVITVMALIAITTSCVSTKVYKDLEDKYAELAEERDSLAMNKEVLKVSVNKLENQNSKLLTEYENVVEERNKLTQEKSAIENNLANLKASYDALEKQSEKSLADNAKKNRELLEKLEKESDRLTQLASELEKRSARIDELEAVIAAKDAAMKRLKESLSKALLDFEGNGLTIEQRDGKVYVSMENKLLFSSGSWYVGTDGKKAVMQLATVLAQNPDISVLIEGHTDNVPYAKNGVIDDNWDLSVKRATAIVKLLIENLGIDPANITAAGRSEFAPVATNETKEGKAKNRRIEVILTPKLDEVTKLLSDVE